MVDTDDTDCLFAKDEDSKYVGVWQLHNLNCDHVVDNLTYVEFTRT